jgi:hypothetical protein
LILVASCALFSFVPPSYLSCDSRSFILFLTCLAVYNQSTGWAISTDSALTIQNTCFIDNNFIREAPVIVFDEQPVVASNNFGTFDDRVACQFIIEIPDDEALEDLEKFTCIEYDAAECKATK